MENKLKVNNNVSPQPIPMLFVYCRSLGKKALAIQMITAKMKLKGGNLDYFGI